VAVNDYACILTVSRRTPRMYNVAASRSGKNASGSSEVEHEVRLLSVKMARVYHGRQCASRICVN